MSTRDGMSDPFSAKFAFILKALSLTRAQVARQLGVDKSLVGRWATGAARPSAYNLSRITTLIADRYSQFTMLDWDLGISGIAQRLGVGEALKSNDLIDGAFHGGLTAELIELILSTTAYRGAAYEGFFRTTRPFFDMPGRFIYDYAMLRMGSDGLLTWLQGTGGVFVTGRMMALLGQMIVIGTQATSQSPVFGIVNGVNGLKAQQFEGLILHSALDAGRTPVSFPFVSERIADLSGNADADEAFFREFAQRPVVAPAEAVPAELRAKLMPDIGPKAFADGGDLLLNLALARSWSRAAIPD